VALVTKLAPQRSQLQRCETLPSLRSAEASGATIGSEQDSHLGKSRARGQKLTCDRTFSADCNMKPPYPPGTQIASRCRIFSTSAQFPTARSLMEISTALILGRGADLLIVRADRKEPLVVIPLRLAAEVAAGAEHSLPR
jgi:hypothetical protein